MASTDLVLHAQSRTTLGKTVKNLRAKGSLPAVVYGHGVDATSIALQTGEFQRVYRASGESTLVDLVIDDAKPTKVIVQDVQRHPVSGAVIHVDFHQVRMTEKLRTEIPLAFSGEPAAVKELGGVLVKNIDHLEVEALPTDLVHEISVDLSVLKTFEDAIRVSDIVMPKGLSAVAPGGEVVAVVTPPRSEQELAALEEKVEEKVEDVEGVKKEPVAGEAGTEDQAATPAPTETKKPE